MARRAKALGAERTRVVHLGSDLPADATPAGPRRIVTVASLIARKRHADVLRALWLLRESHPAVEWVVVGDGPERGALEALARELGLGERVRFTGPLPHADAVAQARRGIFVLPSVDEAFGVAYVEAMAGGVPAIGCRGEDGPEEIAASGDGIRLVPPADPEALAAELDALLQRDDWRHELGAAARATVARSFTWEGCGRATVEAYEQALA
jgi:teichuronic acid biosynthesis glycosyltransferase TuaC